MRKVNVLPHNPLGVKVGDRIKVRDVSTDDKMVVEKSATVIETRARWFRCRFDVGGYTTCLHYITKCNNYNNYAYRKIR